MSEFHVPDEVGVIVGWRAWQVRADEPCLYSLGHDDELWTPREAKEAICSKGCDPLLPGNDPNSLPGDKCSCGFYSARDFRHLHSMGYDTYSGEINGWYCVVGAVTNWGRYVKGTQGWRARMAYPRKLWVPYEIWELASPDNTENLGAVYGVPVALAQWLTLPHRKRVNNAR